VITRKRLSAREQEEGIISAERDHSSTNSWIRWGLRSAIVTSLVASLAAVTTAPAPAVAADLDVCPSGCTYDSIASAVAVAAPGDTIQVAAGTYADPIVVPTATTPLTIVGAGRDTTVLDGEGLRTVLRIPAGVELTLQDLTITRGRGVRDGGVIGSGNGGAIANEGGSITLRQVTVSDSVGEDRGGAIWNNGGIVIVEDSLMSGNSSGDPDQPGSYRGLGGGAIASNGTAASVTVRRSEFRDNIAVEPTTDFRGGAAINSSLGDVTIEDSTIAGNAAGYSSGAVDVRGSGAVLEVRRSHFFGNTAQLGGAMQVRSSAVATIEDSTFSQNSATGSYGAVRVDTSRVTISNTTFSGNSAGSGVGALATSGGITLDSVTIVDNTATTIGGLRGSGATPITAINTIIANNSDTDGYPDCFGLVEASTPVLVEDPTGCTPSGAVLTGLDPALGPLADNGGPTPTRLPDVGSPVIDAGATSLASDQRGLPRPSGSAADLGAVELQVVTDTEAPTFAGGTLIASDVGPTSARLTWSAATDDTGVAEYLVSDGVTVVATVPAPDTTTVVSGLTPESSTTFTVQARDAAGNTSTDGPSTLVTTPPLPPSGHIGPSTASADLDWADTVPFTLVQQAGSAGNVLVVASAGSHPQVRAEVTPFVPSSLDLDGDGVDDVEVEARPGVGALGPSMDVVVDRLTNPGPSDVEVIAILDLGIEFGSALPAALINGFRTLAPGGVPGGTLPASETLRFDTAAVVGLEQRITYGYDTTGPTGPLLFVAGVVEGDRSQAGAANVMSMELDQIPATVDISFGIASSDVDDVANAGFAASLEWQSTPSNVRPAVTFAYGERERRTKVSAEHDLTVLIDRIAPQQRLLLESAADSQSADQGRLEFTGASSTVPVDEVSVTHRRADGLVMRGGLLHVVDDVQLTVTPDGALRLGDGSSPDTRLFFELVHPGRDFFDGSFSQPISTVFGSLRNRRASTVVDSATDTTADISISTQGGLGELVVVATSDRSDLGLAGLGGVWPAGDPLDWSFRRPSSASDAFVRAGIVDDGTRSTVALHTNAFSAVEIDLDPETLSQIATLEARNGSTLDVDVELAAGTPFGGTAGTTLSCEADLPGVPVGLAVEPPDRYGVTSTAPITAVDCRGERGDRTATFLADRIPANSQIELVDVTATSGRFALTAPEIPAARRFLGLSAEVEDPNGLLPDTLLGLPATYLKLEGDGVPSASVAWDAADDTTVEVTSLHPEDDIDELGVVIASKRPTTFEDGTIAPPGAYDPQAPLIGRADSSFRLYEAQTYRLIAGTIRDARNVELRHRVADGGIVATTDTTLPHDLVAQLYLPAGGRFSPQLGLDGACSVFLPGAVTEVEFVPDGLVKIASDAPLQPTSDAVDCRVTASGGPLGDRAVVDMLADELPPETTLSFAPGVVSLRTVGGATGRVEADVTDLSGAGLFGAELFERPMSTSGVLLDGATVVDAEWNGAVDTAFAVDTYGNPAVHIGVRAGTDSSPSWSAVGRHEVDVKVGDVDEESWIRLQLDEIRRAGVTLTGGPEPVFSGEIRTESPRPLHGGFSTDAQVALDVALDILDVPTQLTFSTDLTNRIELDASTSIRRVEIDATLGTGPSDTDGNRATQRTADVVLAEVPDSIDIHLDRIVRQGAGAVVIVASRLGTFDAVVTTNESNGLDGRGVDRARLRLDDVPRSVFVDVSNTVGGVTEPDALAIRGRTGSPVGRVLLELTGDDPMFDTGFRRVFAQLVSIPPNWDISVVPESGGTTASFEFNDDIDVGPPSINDAVDRVEVMASQYAYDPSADDPGSFLDLFADPASSAVTRSALVEQVDDSYWPAGVASTLDDLFGVGVPLPTGTATIRIAPDGAGGQTRTVALQDHLVVAGMNKDGPLDLSLALSEVHAGSFSSAGGTSSLELVRPDTFDGGGLFLGLAGGDAYGYTGPTEGDLEPMVPEAPDGAPGVPRTSTTTLAWNQPSLLEVGRSTVSTTPAWSSWPTGTERRSSTANHWSSTWDRPCRTAIPSPARRSPTPRATAAPGPERGSSAT
jgi:hypothetical protein